MLDLGTQLVIAVLRLHTDARVAHCDLKPENILIDENGLLRLADFGLSVDLREPNPQDRGGTPTYMAPERQGGWGTIDERADVWAIGAILLMLAGLGITLIVT